MVTPLPYYSGRLAHGPGASCPAAWATCPEGEARRPTCNHLINHSPQAYEAENKKIASVLSCKNVQKKRYHVYIFKAANIGHKIFDQIHFLWRLVPASLYILSTISCQWRKLSRMTHK